MRPGAARRALAGLGLAAGLLAAAAPVATAAPEAATTNFAAVADATSTRVVEEAPGILPLGLAVDLGGTTAQAGLDSLGNSNAYAAAADPGRTVDQTAGGLPTAASSAHPATPKAEASIPGQHAIATSDEDRSTANAAVGVDGVDGAGSGTAARADVARGDDGHVEATAVSTAQGFQIAGVLSITSVRGTAAITRQPDGSTSRSSSLDIHGLTVAGVGATLTRDGIVVAGVPVPLGVDTLGPALAAAGVTIDIARGTESDSSVTSDAVRVVLDQDTPQGHTRTTYVLGRANAAIDAARPVAASTPPPSPTTIADHAAPVASPGTSTPSPVPSTTVPPPAPPDEQSADATPASGAGQFGGLFDALSFYLVLVVAAGLTIGATTLLRLMGVRSAWT